MARRDGDQTSERAEAFRRGAEKRRMSLAGEFWHFLKHNKKWWLLPILVVLLLLGVLVFVTNAASVLPFLYMLF